MRELKSSNLSKCWNQPLGCYQMSWERYLFGCFASPLSDHVSCCCDGQQSALRDSEAMTFCEQEAVVGFASVFLSGYWFVDQLLVARWRVPLRRRLVKLVRRRLALALFERFSCWFDQLLVEIIAMTTDFVDGICSCFCQLCWSRKTITVEGSVALFYPAADLVDQLLTARMTCPMRCRLVKLMRRRFAHRCLRDSAVGLSFDCWKSHSPKSSSSAQHIEFSIVRKSRIQYLCDPQWFRDTASRGPTTIVAPESQFRTCPSDHGITDSACKNQLVVVSVQYSPFNPYIPIRSTTIGKSKVAKDPIAMHTSWRSNSDIASVLGYPRMSASGESSTTMHRLLHASGSHPISPPDDPNRQDIAGASPERRSPEAAPPRILRAAAAQSSRQARRTAARYVAQTAHNGRPAAAHNDAHRRPASKKRAASARSKAGHRRAIASGSAASPAQRLRKVGRRRCATKRGQRASSSRDQARPAHFLVARDAARAWAGVQMTTLLATRAWLRPVSRGNRYFTVDCGRLRQSGPRPDARLLRQPALEGLTRSVRTDSPRQVGRNKFRRLEAAAATATCLERKGAATFRYLCDPQWFRDTASRGPTTIVAPESQFRTCPMDHDSIGYPRMSASGESSTTMHRLLHALGSHPISPPDDPKTNQYNHDLGLIHSTNGNHLESPNEGSSIDHQVTIYLHAQNITMFPTNETCYSAGRGAEPARGAPGGG
ncbi:putative RNA-dependent RNA polymerase 1 [Dorcoceras hygrometricum]|uniref:Putative RNA-dependent RNA polymerase 1 n=1 Tax=Dorcoceras hygrometricum TaxID=472368 RepID=A0A2Z7BST1_9LAMI|nr:putative RNA-dependent RNA polymerase 1 [Dorcoceras hygrometricum]